MIARLLIQKHDIAKSLERREREKKRELEGVIEMERETLEITGYKKYNERLGEGERERGKKEN